MSSLVRLNVGGVVFTTRKETLTLGSPYFAAMFGNDMIPGETIDDAIFLDRNGKLFEYVLDYLRKLDKWSVPSDPDLLLNLYDEAEYFCLDGLIEKIRQRVPRTLMSFDVYLKFDTRYNVVSSCCGKHAPQHVVDFLLEIRETKIEDRLDISKVKHHNPYRNVIPRIQHITKLHYDTTITMLHSDDTPSQIIISCSDRYRTPTYEALRAKLYPVSN